MERYVVNVADDTDRPAEHAFKSKGLAFAYVTRKRRRPDSAQTTFTVEHQFRASETKSWAGVNTWTFHPNGDVNHRRL